MALFADEERAIQARLASNFTTLPIKYENGLFNQPNNSPWVALSILRGSGRQISTKAPSALKRWVGVIQIDIYVPEDTGSRTALTHADTIVGIFDSATFNAGSSGRILCRAASVSPGMVMDGWYRVSVSVPYQRDSTT